MGVEKDTSLLSYSITEMQTVANMEMVQCGRVRSFVLLFIL